MIFGKPALLHSEAYASFKDTLSVESTLENLFDTPWRSRAGIL